MSGAPLVNPERARAIRRDKIARWNPVGMFLSPVFLRDMRSAGRAWTTYFFRAGVGFMLLLVVVLSYIGARDQASYMGPAARLQALQSLAPTIGFAIIWFQFVALMLLAPVLSASCICDERRARTIPALMTTPMTSAEIIYGNLASKSFQLLILVLITFPMLLAIRVYGGLPVTFLGAGLAITLSATVMAISISLLCSVLVKRPTMAISAAFSAIVFVLFAPIVVQMLWAARVGVPPTPGLALFGTSAVFSLAYVSIELIGGTMGMVPVPYEDVWHFNVGWNLSIALTSSILATFALRRLMRREGGAEVALTRKERKKLAKAARKKGDADAMAAAAPGELVVAGSSRTVSDRPVLWRELRQKFFDKRWKLIVATVGVVLLFVYLYLDVGLEEEALHAIVSVIGILIIVFQAATTTTGGVTSEREARTWEALCSTRLRPGEILFAKYVGAVRKQLFVPIILWAHVTISVIAGAIAPIMLIHMVPIVLGPILFLSGTGILFSLIVRKSSVATVLNVLLAATVWLGVLIVWGIVGSILVRITGGDNLAELGLEVLVFPNPVGMFVFSLMEAQSHAQWGVDEYNMPANEFTPLAFTVIVTFVYAAEAFVGLLAVRLAVALFPRFGGRSS